MWPWRWTRRPGRRGGTTKYAAPFKETCSEQLGPRRAPRRSSRAIGSITVSAGGLMNSFDRRTGHGSGRRDVLEDRRRLRACGYSSSPVAYKNTIITTAGGPGRGVVALDAATGRIVWQSQDFQNGYSSPIIIDLDGRPELIVFTYGEIAGLESGHRRARMEPPAHGGSGRERGDADLGRRSPAVRVVGVQRRQPRAEARADRRRRDGRRSLGEQARARSFRQRRAARRAHLRVERRLRLRAVRGRRRRRPARCLAGSQRHPRDADRRRQPARHPRRGRQPGARDAGRAGSSCTRRRSSSGSAPGRRRRSAARRSSCAIGIRSWRSTWDGSSRSRIRRQETERCSSTLSR